MQQYITSGHDKDIVDPTADKVYLKQVGLQVSDTTGAGALEDNDPIPFPSSGWGKSLHNLPQVSKATIDQHVAKSGKKKVSVPTGQRRAKQFLQENYLHEIETNSNDLYFFVKAKCFRSYKKNEQPHNLKIVLHKDAGNVSYASCTCVAGLCGFCNHILAVLMKLCQFCLFESENVSDDEEVSCTSKPQQWHKKGRTLGVMPEPIMEVGVQKISEVISMRDIRDDAITCYLYEARVHQTNDVEAEKKLKASLTEENILIGMAHLLCISDLTTMTETTMGSFPVGAPLSYQLAVTEANFKVTSSVPPSNIVNSLEDLHYPVLPCPADPVPVVLEQSDQTEWQEIMDSQQITKEESEQIERSTRRQSNCSEWHENRAKRLTASRFHEIVVRRSQHEKLAERLCNAKPFHTKATEHGKQYEAKGLREYEKYMKKTGRTISVLKAGLVVNPSMYWLAASPDARVIDTSCDQPFGLAEVKCPHSKFSVTPEDACLDKTFCCLLDGGKVKLKKAHAYYSQIQGQMGVSGIPWVEFIVYAKEATQY